MNKPVSLPKTGEFFLLDANNGRTYWAWDFGKPPTGEDIHLVYTNAKKSDYIGVVHIERQTTLAPCVKDCLFDPGEDN